MILKFFQDTKLENYCFLLKNYMNVKNCIYKLDRCSLSGMIYMFTFCVFVFFQVHQAKAISDEDLLITINDAIAKRYASHNQLKGIQIIQESLSHLSDAEKIRAMALEVYEMDKDRQFGMRYDTPSLVTDMLGEDPLLIRDPSELKKMMANEKDPRRFFILASMAGKLMLSIKGADFIQEMSPMLFKHDPLARMGGEYVFERLSNASFFTSDIITRNLKALNSSFPPPQEKLPYPEKVEILVKWLRENWKGCENLGMIDAKGDGRPFDKRAPRGSPQLEIFQTAEASSDPPSTQWPMWTVLVGVCILAILIVKYVKFSKSG